MAKYVCKNYGSCSKADGRVEVEVPAGVEPICEEDGSRMHPVDGDSGGGSKAPLLIAATVAGVIVIAVVAFLLVRANSGKKAATEPRIIADPTATVVTTAPTERQPAGAPATCDQEVRIAISYLMDKNLTAAERELAAAAAKCPDDYFVDYNLAILRSAQGNSAAGVDSLENAFRKGFKDFEALEKDDDMVLVRREPRYAELIQRYRGGAR